MTKCPNGHENPEGQAFCGQCGQALVQLPMPPVLEESQPPLQQQKRRISPATVWLVIGGLVLLGIVVGNALTNEQPSSSEQGSGQGVKDDSESVDSTDAFTMPDVVGVGLQDAQDSLQSLGSFVLDQEDASGMGRIQILDSNWVVCEQSPAAGVEASVDDLITLWSVQIGESCH